MQAVDIRVFDPVDTLLDGEPVTRNAKGTPVDVNAAIRSNARRSIRQTVVY